MTLKAILFLCLSVAAMIAVLVFYFWWVGRELDRNEGDGGHLDNDSDEK